MVIQKSGFRRQLILALWIAFIGLISMSWTICLKGSLMSQKIVESHNKRFNSQL